MIRIIGSKDLLFTGVRILSPAAAFLRVEGTSSEGIIVDGGDLRKAKKQVLFENGAAAKSAILRS